MTSTYEVPAHMSNSQLNDFQDCSWKYALDRVLKVPKVPGIALVGGKAFHWATELVDEGLDPRGKLSKPSVVKSPLEPNGATEEPDAVGTASPRSTSYGNLLRQEVDQIDWEKFDLEATVCPGEVADVWHLALSTEVLAESERNNLFPDPKDWKAAGRTSKALPAGEDLNWWTSQGTTQLWDYLRWRRSSGWQLAYFGGEPMVELDISCTIAGVPINGFLDRIMIDPNGVAVLVDIKTSRTEPSSTAQLGLYKVALETLGLPAPTYGAYYMSRDGRMGRPRNLTRYTPEMIGWKYGETMKQRDAGVFVANDKSSYCGSCPFREYCYEVGGSRAHELPKPWELGAVKVKLPLTVTHRGA